MRLMYITTILVSIACSSLQAEPLVVMADKLLKTSAGRVLQRRLGQFIGQRFSYTYEYHGAVFGFSGKLERIVVPDITRLDGRIADAEFRAGFG